MPKKVLIVDDFPFDAELTRTALETFEDELEIVAVENGEEALRVLIESPSFDIILLDLRMPLVDGFEVLKQLSSRPFLSDVPVIVLSSSRSTSDRIRMRMLGAAEFVEKGIDYTTFRQELTRSLGRYGFA